MLDYISSTDELEKNSSYSHFNGLSEGKAGNLRLRTPYLFSKNEVQWCLDFNSRTEETKRDKFPEVNCPVIVIYLDLLTSKLSRKFLEDVLSSSDFRSKLKNQIDSYVFVLTREAEVFSSESEKMSYFRDELNSGREYGRSFISYNFYYDGDFSSFCSDSLDHN